eukprot:4345331-Prymnesium_polylepis.1
MQREDQRVALDEERVVVDALVCAHCSRARGRVEALLAVARVDAEVHADEALLRVAKAVRRAMQRGVRGR